MWSPSDKDALGFAVPSLPALLAYLTKKRAFQQQLKNWSFGLLALPTKARIGIVFRFIIEYSSLRDFGPY
jgi:hypothetical protein